MPPFISVIIIAYNRKQFILDAIKSVQQQTLNAALYEIIVIKNFKDKKIDGYINKSGIKNVYLSPAIACGIGYKAITGAKMAKGKVICFLEDDDLFDRNKLKVVYKFFHNNKVGLYHNAKYVLYKNKIINKHYIDVKSKFEVDLSKKLGKDVKMKFLDPTAQLGNNSSLAIKKDIIKFKTLKKVKLAFDAALIISALASEYNLIFDNKVLTIYRIHESNFSIDKALDYDNFIKKWQKLSEQNYLDWIKLRSIHINDKSIDDLIYQNFLLQKLNYLVYAKRARKAVHFVNSVKFVYINLKYGNLNKKVIERIVIALIFLISPKFVKRLFYFAQFKKAKF